MVGFGVSVHLI